MEGGQGELTCKTIHSFRSSCGTSTTMKTLHKALIVLLCLEALLAVVEGEGIDSSTHTGFEINQTVTVICPGVTVSGGSYGRFLFPETIADVNGVDVKVECPYGFRDDGLQSVYDGHIQQTKESKVAQSGAIRTCILSKSEDDGTSIGKWLPFNKENDIKYCKEIGWQNSLKQWETTIKNLTPTTFRVLIPLMKEVAAYAYRDHEMALALINGIDSALRNPLLGPDAIPKSDREIVLTFVGVYSTVAADFMPPGYKSQVGDGGIIVETAKFYGMDFIRSKDGMNFGNQRYVTNLATLSNTDVGIDISAQALQMSLQNTIHKEPKLKITAYSEDVFRVWSEGSTSSDLLDESKNNETREEDCEIVDGTCSNALRSWGLLTIELDGMIQNLTEPIEFVISDSAIVEGNQMKCVYWDTDVQTWSTDGVKTIPTSNGVKCESTHLTAFSALIEPLPLPFPDAEYAPINNSVHSFILSILSSIGSVCSIVGLSFTLLTYGLFRSLRRERSNRILINLSASLLLMHIMSISGSKSLWDGFCFVPAASLHYLVLTSFAWMMVEAVHMFELLISVFVRPENRFLIKRFVLAWGIPLIIVGVCTAVDPEVYTDGRADLCLMNAHRNIVLYYTAYIGPICIMLLVNIIIFGRIFRVLYQQTKRTNGNGTNANGNGAPPRYQFVKISPSQIKGATTVLVLLGIGWTLGLLAIGPFEVFFRYMYCVCNAGQGLFIFIFRVLLNPHASKQWKKVILGLSSDSSLDSSLATTSTTGSGGRKRKSKTISPTFISASNSVENSLTASNPLTTTLAATLASILKSEDARAATVSVIDTAK